MLASSTNYIDYRAETWSPNPDAGVVVDLAKNNRIERLLQYEDISDDLSLEEEQKLVDYIESCFEMSHAKISKRYDHWKEADRAHDVYVPPDATSFREKAVITDTRAVADTVLTYLMSALAGRNPMFQIEGEGRENRKVAALFERILHKQIRKTAGEARIAQLLSDSVRYGLAPTKLLWNSERNQNEIINFDPRRTFPDPRVNWGDWDNMQYVGFASWASFDAIAKTGLYPKTQKYPALRRNPAPNTSSWSSNRWNREEGRGLSVDQNLAQHKSQAGFKFYTLGDARVLNEIWMRLSGPDVNLPNIQDLWLVATVLDEKVVIRLQVNPYGQQFPVVMGGLFNDYHKTFGQSLYDIMLPLHDIATWMLRSRIDNVQASLNNLIFADPQSVNIADIVNKNPWGLVRTLPGTKPGDGVFVANVPDVTQSHYNDINIMSDLKQRVTAASDAQQGMPTADVRTATEIQRLTQLGSQRLGVLSRIMSATTIRPMVRMMTANIQDAIAFDGSVVADPTNTPAYLADMVQDGYIDFSIKDLQGEVDYLVIDGTLPTEPSRDQESWLNVLQIMSQTSLGQEYNLGMIAEEAIRAGGIHDLDRFRISKEQRQANGPLPYQQLEMMEKMRGASVQPQDKVSKEIDKGNLAPMSEVQR